MTVRPPPVAVTVIEEVPAAAADVAAKVSAEAPLAEESVTGLTLHDAVTPGGRPLTLSVTGPANTALAVRAIASTTDEHAVTDGETEAAAMARVGGVRVIVKGTF